MGSRCRVAGNTWLRFNSDRHLVALYIADSCESRKLTAAINHQRSRSTPASEYDGRGKVPLSSLLPQIRIHAARLETMSFRTPVFTAVEVMLREQDALAGCPHIAEMVSEYLDTSNKWTIERAACAGYLTLLDRLGKKELPISPRELDWALRTAADRGDLSVVKWLTAYQPDMECSTRVMDSAALRGHLNIIKWLHHYRDEGCSTAAMDSAAAYGRLDVVQWLHENREEGCTTAAMDSAAAGGHLKTVQWLAANRKEGCTSVASHFALLNGHMHILRWLNEQNVEMQDSDQAMGTRSSTRWYRRERRLSATLLEAPRHRPRRMSMGLSCRS